MEDFKEQYRRELVYQEIKSNIVLFIPAMYIYLKSDLSKQRIKYFL